MSTCLRALVVLVGSVFLMAQMVLAPCGRTALGADTTTSTSAGTRWTVGGTLKATVLDVLPRKGRAFALVRMGPVDGVEADRFTISLDDGESALSLSGRWTSNGRKVKFQPEPASLAASLSLLLNGVPPAEGDPSVVVRRLVATPTIGGKEKTGRTMKLRVSAVFDVRIDTPEGPRTFSGRLGFDGTSVPAGFNLIPSSIEAKNNRLHGVWREVGSGDPNEIRFYKTGRSSGTTGGFQRYSISTNGKYILYFDPRTGGLALTHGFSFTSGGWLVLDRAWLGVHYFRKDGENPDCPAAVVIDALDELEGGVQLSIENSGLPLLTGYGAIFTMRVYPETRPDGSSWAGLQIHEDVSPDSDLEGVGTFAPGGTICACNTTATCTPWTLVGSAFNDEHRVTSGSASLLHLMGKSQAVVTCDQTYRCGDHVLGSFVITYTLTRDDVKGVTRVKVAKAAAQ